MTPAAPSASPAALAWRWFALAAVLISFGTVSTARALPVRELSTVSYFSKYQPLRFLESQERAARVPETRIRDLRLRRAGLHPDSRRLNEELIRVCALVYDGLASVRRVVSNNPIKFRDPRGLDVSGLPADIELELGFNDVYRQAQQDPNLSVHINIEKRARLSLQDPLTGERSYPKKTVDQGLNYFFDRRGVSFGMVGGATLPLWEQTGVGVLIARMTIYAGSAALYLEMGDTVGTNSPEWDDYRDSLSPQKIQTRRKFNPSKLGNLPGMLEDECGNTEDGRRRVIASKIVHELTHALRSRMGAPFGQFGDFSFGGADAEISRGDEYFPQLNAMDFLLRRRLSGR